MRILFCNKYNFRFSGTEAYLFDLMDLLESQGHAVSLFSMDHGRPSNSHHPQYLVPRVDFKENRHRPLAALKLASHAIYSRSVRRRLREAIADFRPDLAHVRNIYHHLSPSVLWELRLQKVPVLYHVNDFKLICPTYNGVCGGETCRECRGGEFWHVVTRSCYPGSTAVAAFLAAEAYLQRWLGTYSKCITRLLAPTEFVRRLFVESGWNPSQVDVLYHFQRLGPEPPPPSGEAPVLYFGRLSPEKGVVDLLRAMRRVPGIPLCIAGEGPQLLELQQLARELNLENVSFLGHLQGRDLNQAIASSRFTVFPSRGYEVLGKTILESYAQARPVIATDLGSRRELVLDGKTGLLYPPGDTIALASCIASLYSRPGLAESMGRAGRSLVQSRHSPGEHLATLTRIYETLIAPAHRLSPSSRKLKVAFIGGRGVVSRYSGIETYYEEVGKRLVELGHDVTIYCRNYFTPPLENYLGMRLLRLPTIRTKHLDTLIHTFISTVHACFSDYDIVQYHALGPALFSFFPRLTGKKTIATVQGLDWQRKKWGRLASRILKVGERAAISFPNATIVVSRVLADYYRSRGHPIYIPNGTQLSAPAPVLHLPEWGLQPGNYILFLGRFSPEKNCDLLIRAYERLKTDVKLVLAGGSSYSDHYTRELQTHASDTIRLLNWISGEPLHELLTNAMLFVLPSDMEGLSLALLDAMGAGLCVVTSDVPENRELVQGVGYTFSVGNEFALSELLRLLIANPSLRHMSGRAAQERVRQQYLWPDIARRIVQEYFRILGEPAAVEETARTAA